MFYIYVGNEIVLDKSDTIIEVPEYLRDKPHIYAGNMGHYESRLPNGWEVSSNGGDKWYERYLTDTHGTTRSFKAYRGKEYPAETIFQICANFSCWHAYDLAFLNKAHQELKESEKGTLEEIRYLRQVNHELTKNIPSEWEGIATRVSTILINHGIEKFDDLSNYFEAQIRAMNGF